MVTRADLLKDDEEQAIAYQLELAKKAERKAQADKEWAAKCIVWGMGLVDGELGEAIRELNKAGHKKIRVGTNYVQVPTERDDYGNTSWTTQFTIQYRLPFNPDPKLAGTNLLLENLTTAGFEVRLETKVEPYYEYSNDEDSSGRIAGYKDNHYLYISWE